MSEDTAQIVAAMTAKARAAARTVARATDRQKADALLAAATAMREAAPAILAANAQDMEAGAANGLSAAMLDRLKLDESRLEGVASAVAQVAMLEDPVGQVIDRNKFKLLRLCRCPTYTTSDSAESVNRHS